jgi:hypothetical protein
LITADYHDMTACHPTRARPIMMAMVAIVISAWHVLTLI